MMEIDRLIKNLEDEAWSSKWVEEMSDKNLFTVLAACNQAPGPVVPSTRGLYEKLMLQILKRSPAETVTSIDKYLATNDEARGEWLAAKSGNLDVVDQLPPGITPMKNRERTRSSSRTPPGSPSAKAAAPAPTTPLSGKRDKKTHYFGLRTGLRSGRKEEEGSVQDDGPLNAAADISAWESHEPFTMRKREVGSASPRGKVKTSSSSPKKAEEPPKSSMSEAQKANHDRNRARFAEGIQQGLKEKLRARGVLGFIALMVVVGYSYYLIQ
ncbi:unnamed protein product [Orchesella dallaii]|uniref:LEM domain-containing protein n=1 Tax=Orchesella dallaii TaxID=48710 RepID=A0ABP1QZR5_9HEXA